jgi:hypothetical protein
VLRSETFRSFVKACVGGQAKLLQVLLDDVVQLVSSTCESDLPPAKHMSDEMLKRSKGLWATFPVEVDSGLVLKQFQSFALAHELSVDLHQHPCLLKFVFEIAPGILLSTQPSASPSETSADILSH